MASIIVTGHTHCFCIINTRECCVCDMTIDMIECAKKGIADFKAGRMRPWLEIKAELGIDG